MFCQKCGAEISDGSAFCSGCGQPVAGANVPNQGVVNNPYPTGQQPNNNQQGYGAPQPNYYTQSSMQYGYGQVNMNVASNPMYVSIANKARTTETVVSVCWIILGVLQIIIALAATSYIFVAIAGIWNIINAAICLKNTSTIVAGNESVVGYFEKRLGGLITILVVNLLIGGFVGVILAIVDLVNRNYVLNNRMVFESN